MNDESSPTIGGTRYTVEDLSAYADRGRTPRIAAIEEDAECRAVLDGIERLGALSRELLADDVARAPKVDESWIDRVITSIGRELRAGRDIPLADADGRTSTVITEGAVRELTRAAGDSVEGVIVGGSRISGDVDVPDGAVSVAVTISVVTGVPVRERAEAVRDRIRSELQRHTRLRIEAVDVTVVDLHEPPAAAETT